MRKLITCLVMLCATMAHATNDDVVNSQMYVDNLVGNLQTNLPAKTSEKVVTYTTTAGTTGERDIKTTLGNESTNQSDSGLTTVGTVKTAVDDKQNKLKPLNNVNIVTYTGSTAGTYNGPGIATTTPIYDSTVNTFDNGLVRAKTLNDAVIAGVNSEATKITTDPKGALWVFNRTPPKVLPTTANLPANINGTSYCYVNSQGSCSDALYNSISRGDWGVVFPYNTGITYDTTCSGTYCNQEIHGISACSNIATDELVFGTIVPSEYWTALETSYNDFKNTQTLPTDYKHCYCKLKKPTFAGARWVRGIGNAFSSTSVCLLNCAMYCAQRVKEREFFRGVLFSASPVSAQ